MPSTSLKSMTTARTISTRRSFLAMLLAGSLYVLTGCGGGDETKRIIILTNGPDPFWDTCEAGAKEAEERLGLRELGYRVDFQRGEFTDQSQIDKLKQYATAGDVVAVGISVFNKDSLAIAEEMRKLQDLGIHVITIDGDVDREKFRDARYAYLGTDNVIGGRELGRAAGALNPEANFAFFVGNKGAANAIERMNGFVQGIGEEAHEVERLADDGDSVVARANVESTLSRNDEVDMLVGIWAYNTPQIVNVVQERGIRDETHVMCFDAAAESIIGMEAGNVDVMVVQNPYQMGQEGVRMMLAMVQDDQSVMNEMLPDYAKEEERDIFRTELRVVVPNGETPIKEDLFERDTQYFTLSEFRKWLSDRGLSSS